MLLQAIQRHCEQTPQKAAYVSGSEALTYGAMWEKAARLAQTLSSADGPVLVYGRKQPTMPVAFLACLLAGQPYLPCDPAQPPERLRLILQQSGAETMLCAEPLPQAVGVKSFDIAALLTQSHAPAGWAISRPENPDAYWIFTSGSTGTPKGVRVTLANLEHFVQWALGLPAIADCAAGVAVNQASFSFDLSVADLWPTLAAGGTIFALDRAEQADWETLYRALAASRGTRLTGTPSFLRYCLCDPAFCRALMPQLQTIFCCGEVLPARTVRALRQRFPGVRVLNAYGPTESTCAVCAVEVDEAMPEPLPVGCLSDAATEIKIVDEAGAPLPDGQTGEILLCGLSVAAGYCNAPQWGFGSDAGQPAYRTGDLGHVQNDLLYYVGRRDRQIKYKGYRIEPGEIEAALSAWGEVRAAAVLPLHRSGQVMGLAACIEWQGAPLSDADCRARLACSLPAYMLPQRFAAVAAMPLTANGKCDRAALAKMLESP